MIIVHSTKKLLAKLPVDDQGQLPLSPKSSFLHNRASSQPGPLSGWHANLLTLQRRNCLLFVHNPTRFPVFIPALKKADLANLDGWFGDSLMNTLLKCGATDKQMERAWQHVQRLQFDTDCDRSVQGTMNQMNKDIDHSLYFKRINVAEITGYRLSAWLADRPCTVKGRRDCIWPKSAFLSLVDSLPDRVEIPEQPDNVIELASYRKRGVSE